MASDSVACASAQSGGAGAEPRIFLANISIVYAARDGGLQHTGSTHTHTYKTSTTGNSKDILFPVLGGSMTRQRVGWNKVELARAKYGYPAGNLYQYRSKKNKLL